MLNTQGMPAQSMAVSFTCAGDSQHLASTRADSSATPPVGSTSSSTRLCRASGVTASAGGVSRDCT